jgi:hypothetical protein
MAMTTCRTCGGAVSSLAVECPVCLAVDPGQRSEPAFWARFRRAKLVLTVLFCLFFLFTCGRLLPIGMRVADPMTNAPLATLPGRPFPVLVVKGVEARVNLEKDSSHIPPPASGWSYLVGPETEARIERYINEHQPVRDGNWVVRVTAVAPGIQRIALYSLCPTDTTGRFTRHGYDSNPTLQESDKTWFCVHLWRSSLGYQPCRLGHDHWSGVVARSTTRRLTTPSPPNPSAPHPHSRSG